MPVPLAIQSYTSGAPPISTERLINGYAESQPKSARTPVAIFGSPGIETFTTCGNGPVRGGIKMGGTLYVVSDTRLFSVTTTGTATEVGAGIEGTSRVGIAQNGSEICIVNGVFGYIYDTTNGLQQITDPSFNPGAKTVQFLDSYFVFDWPGTNKFFHSELLDGLNYIATNFASAESHPDYVVGVLNHGNRLFIFGEETIEPWFDAGASDFPFRIVDGATIPFGCIAPLSITQFDNSPFFLGDDKVYYRLNGINPMRVSTHAIESIWQTYATCADAESTTFSFNGHKFISLKFLTANACWTLDLATGLWHERESLEDSGATRRWRGNTSFEAYGKTFIGDELSGKIGTLSSSVYTEFSSNFSMVLVNPPIHDPRGRRMFMPLYELEIDKGVGLNTGQGSDPQIMLQISDTRGHTYSEQEKWKSMGETGKYGGICLRWDRLGSFYSRVIKLTVSDPVKRVILAARAPGMYTGT